MKIGITADLHLKSKDETPERYNALENIIADLRSKNINRLIVAGDLFDRERYNYNDFDAFCKQYRDIDFYITPGNHDVGIEPRFFSASNIRLFIAPTLVEIDHIPFLFLPYTSSGSMDELLTSFFADKALPDKWVLIGHGDYLEINKSADEYEKDYYMPLSNKVIREMKPLRAFLGHIHKASDSGIVSYPGSPYPLNVNETGKRRFLIYDTDTDSVESRYPHTDIVYMIEKLLIIPTENEIDDALEKIDHAIAKWGFTDEELSKVKLRLILKGFTNDKGALMDAEAWNMPDVETDVRVVIQTSNEMKFTVDYYLASGRWSFFNGENVKMKNINDLNAGMIYNITPAISLNVRVHNILSKKYDIWYGYPAQTINILGGFAFQF